MRYAIVAMLLAIPLASRGWADNLRGTVSDARGNPVVGARIDISTAAPKSGPSLFCPSCYLDCAKSTKSDEQGRFEFTSLDPTLKFRLLATAPDMQTASTDLLDPAQDLASITLPDFPMDISQDRILRGRVLSTEGVPVSGALVEPYGAKTASRRWGGRVDGASPAVTDDDGYFRMLLPEAYIAIDLQVTAYGYPGTVAELLPPGESLHQITVPCGTTVTGRLFFQGQPQVGQTVAVVQVNRSRSDRIFIKAVATTTDDDGRFQFAALPASEPYAIFSPVRSGATGPVLPTMLFNAKEDHATRDLGDLDLVPGLTLAGRLQMTDGTKIPEGIPLTLGRMPAWDLIEVPTDKDGCFRIENLPPETYEISLMSEEVLLDELRSSYQILGAWSFGLRLTDSCIDLLIPIRRLREGEAPLRYRFPSSQATLGDQTLSGKVVDRNGSPVSGIELCPYLARGSRTGKNTAITKADGRFTISNLPDEPIELMFFDPNAFGYPAGITSTGAAGQLILYPGRARPQRNQSDIRIVFDPELTTPPVDLK